MEKINENQVADRSRNESNAVDSHERENESPNLIKDVIKTSGDRNHRNGYSLDILANFFRNNYEFAKFVKCANEDERLQINELFERVADCLDFNVYLQRKVATHLKGKFTSDQLSCIFQAYNGILIQYESMNPFEFEIFVNLILEVWGIEDNTIGRMHDFLKSDRGNKTSITRNK